MMNIVAILAIFALPVAFMSGGVAFNAWRTGESGLASKSLGVFFACVVIFMMAPKNYPKESDNCWMEWDARVSRTVCQ